MNYISVWMVYSECVLYYDSTDIPSLWHWRQSISLLGAQYYDWLWIFLLREGCFLVCQLSFFEGVHSVCTSPSAFLLGLYKNVHSRIETQTSGRWIVPPALLVDCSPILTKVLRAFLQTFPPYKVSFQSCESRRYIEDYLKWEKLIWDYLLGIIEIEH
jgi:hypothetical protein